MLEKGVLLADKRLHAVQWDDAHYNNEECNTAEIVHQPWQYVTVGILVRSDAAGVTLATDIGEDGKWRGRNFVPRGMVVEEWDCGPVLPKVRAKRLKPPSPAQLPAPPPAV